MRIKTAHTRRAIDKWKSRAKAQVRRSQAWGLDLVTRLLTSPKRGRVALVPLLVLALLFNFATLEFAMLVLVGFFTVKLHLYRFANLLLRIPSFAPA